MQVAATFGNHVSIDGAAVAFVAAALIVMAAIGFRRRGENASDLG